MIHRNSLQAASLGLQKVNLRGEWHQTVHSPKLLPSAFNDRLKTCPGFGEMWVIRNLFHLSVPQYFSVAYSIDYPR